MAAFAGDIDDPIRQPSPSSAQHNLLSGHTYSRTILPNRCACLLEGGAAAGLAVSGAEPGQSSHGPNLSDCTRGNREELRPTQPFEDRLAHHPVLVLFG